MESLCKVKTVIEDAFLAITSVQQLLLRSTTSQIPVLGYDRDTEVDETGMCAGVSLKLVGMAHTEDTLSILLGCEGGQGLLKFRRYRGYKPDLALYRLEV